MTGPFYTPLEAAAYLGVSATALGNWRGDPAAGGPTFEKVNGRVFYRQSALDAWKAANPDYLAKHKKTGVRR